MTVARVSVVTPTWNGAPFLAETIETVLSQTYEGLEHVLVDDGSTDGTRDILAAYERSHPERIRVVRENGRAGPCRRRNEALDVARGELVAWLDHDDLWEPTKLERQVEALDADPAAVFSFTQYEEFDDATGATLETSSLNSEGDLLARLFVEGCFVASSSVLYRRRAMAERRPRLRDDDFSFGDDYYLWLTLALDGHAVLLDEPLTRLRRHSANESARLGGRNFHVARLELLHEFLTEFPEARERLGAAARVGFAEHRIAAAAYELGLGNRARAAAHAARAARSRPREAFAVARAVARPRTAQGRTSPIP